MEEERNSQKKESNTFLGIDFGALFESLGCVKRPSREEIITDEDDDESSPKRTQKKSRKDSEETLYERVIKKEKERRSQHYQINKERLMEAMADQDPTKRPIQPHVKFQGVGKKNEEKEEQKLTKISEQEDERLNTDISSKDDERGIAIYNWQPHEDAKILELVAMYGPKKWAKIASQIEGRSARVVRERYHQLLNKDTAKQERQQNSQQENQSNEGQKTISSGQNNEVSNSAAEDLNINQLLNSMTEFFERKSVQESSGNPATENSSSLEDLQKRKKLIELLLAQQLEAENQLMGNGTQQVEGAGKSQ